MSTATRSVKRIVQLTLIYAAVVFPGVAANSQTAAPIAIAGPGAPDRHVQRLASGRGPQTFAATGTA